MRRTIAVLVTLLTAIALAPAPARASATTVGCPPGCMTIYGPACGEINPDCQLNVQVKVLDAEPLTLTASTIDGTAHADVDYVPLRRVQADVVAGASVVTFHVRLLPRARGQFNVKVVSSDPRMAPAKATVTIDADPAG